jgi:hypothetical protein
MCTRSGTTCRSNTKKYLAAKEKGEERGGGGVAYNNQRPPEPLVLGHLLQGVAGLLPNGGVAPAQHVDHGLAAFLDHDQVPHVLVLQVEVAHEPYEGGPVALAALGLVERERKALAVDHLLQDEHGRVRVEDEGGAPRGALCDAASVLE